MNWFHRSIAILAITATVGTAGTASLAASAPEMQESQAETVVAEDFIGLAQGAIAAQDYKNAIAHTNKALDLNPNSATGYLLRGQARSFLGERQAAIADLREAVALYDRQNNRVGRALALEYLEDITAPNSPQAVYRRQ